MVNTWVFIALIIKWLLVFSVAIYWLKRSRNHAAGTFSQIIIVVVMGVFILPLWAIALPRVEVPLFSAAVYRWFEWDMQWSKTAAAMAFVMLLVTFIKLVKLFFQVAEAIHFCAGATMAPVNTLKALKHVQHSTGFWNSVDIRTAKTQGPFTLGFFKPVIILPVEHTHWSPATLARVLVHELEHIRQQDWFWQLVIKVIAAAVWWLPGINFLQARYQWFCELNADNAVLRYDPSRSDYADDLLFIAQGLTPTANNSLQAVMAIINGSYCFERIAAVLDGTRSHNGAPLKGFTLLLLTAVFWLPLGFISVGVSAAASNNEVTNMREYAFFVAPAPIDEPVEKIFLCPVFFQGEPDTSVEPFIEEVITSINRDWQKETADALGASIKNLAVLEAGFTPPIIQPLVKVHGFIALRAVMPLYPRSARKKLIEGQVMVQFTVLASGMAEDIRIVMANPEGVFDKSVMEAMQASRFKPAMVNGRPVTTTHATQTFTFSLSEKPIKPPLSRVGKTIKTAQL